MRGRNTLLAALVLGAGGSAAAADYVPPPAAAAGTVGGAHPDAAGCASCDGKSSGHGQGLFGRFRRPPVPVTLAPGACFGYFPTQWRKWDEVCPYPYQPAGVTEASRPPVPYPGYSDKAPNGTLPDPRPVDPKPGDPKPPTPDPAPGGARRLTPVPIPTGTKMSPPVPVSAAPANKTLPPIPVPADKFAPR